MSDGLNIVEVKNFYNKLGVSSKEGDGKELRGFFKPSKNDKHLGWKSLEI